MAHWIVLLLVLVAAGFSVEATANSRFFCPYPNGRFPDPADCSRYYECRNNAFHPYQCANYELYDVNAKRCMAERQVNCGNRPGKNTGGNNRFTCPFPNGRYADPMDCSRYYECRNSVPSIYQCPRYQLYDIPAEHCLDGQRVNCGRRPGGNTGNPGGNNRFKCPFPNGRFLDPNDCSRYYECQSSVPSIYKCPRLQLYDAVAEHCLPAKQVNCGRRPFVEYAQTMQSDGGKVVTFDLTCPAIYGRYPVPGFCEYFFECRFGKPYLMHCNKGYLYDKQKEQCIDQRKVKCDGEKEREPNEKKDKEVAVKDFNFKCPYIWGTFAHPYDCSKFFVCNNNYPKMYQCYNNFLYDDRIRKCLPKQKVNCGKRPDKEREKFSCPLPNGRFPDPKDCSRYYECRSSVFHPYQCPVGQLYDESVLHCMAEKTVKCGNRPGGNGGNNRFTCPSPNGRFPDPLDCSLYLECKNSVPKVYQCSRGELYDEKKHECKNENKVDCGFRPGGHNKENLKFKCPYPYGRYSDPQDCSRYYECQNSVASLFVCPKQQLYDETIKHCNGEQYVNCGRRPGGNKGGNNKFTCPSPNGRFSDPQDCSRYYECRASVFHLYQCPPSQLYDETIKHCNADKKVHCGLRPDLNNKGNNKFICPLPNGRFPDPFDCSRYYECRNSVAYPYQCPRTQLYDETILHCKTEQNVNCGKRPGGNDGGNKFYCPFPYGRFADPYDCSRYYECRNSVAYVVKCLDSQLYDERKEHCNDRKHVKCGQRPGGDDTGLQPKEDLLKDYRCLYVWGTFIHPDDCSKYIICIYNVPTIFSCEKDKLFHALHRRCAPKEQVDCNNRINPDVPGQRPGTVAPTSTAVTTSPPTTTTTPTTPVPTTTTTITTPVPTITSPKQPTPTQYPVTKPNTPPPTDCKEDDVDCIIDTTGDIKVWFDCPRRYGHFPHGSSQRLFIHCDNWRPFVKTCAEETVFSPQYLVCVWVDKSKAKS